MAQRDPQREQFWRATLDEWKRSGQSITAFCRSRGFHKSSFHRWQKIFADASRPSPMPKTAFVPLRVVAEAMAEVVLPSGLVIRVPFTADPQAVAKLVAAVRAVAC